MTNGSDSVRVHNGRDVYHVIVLAFGIGDGG